MGFGVDQFVDPAHISDELICPICCGVLERPVQTSTEHLFCEDELLEWMERSETCPVTNRKLDPAEIRKPSRIIMNILGGLMIKCNNRAEGCLWTGRYDTINDHLKTCAHRPREQLIELLNKKSIELEVYRKKYAELKVHCRALEDESIELRSTIESLQRQVKVYGAFVERQQEDEELDVGVNSLKTTGRGLNRATGTVTSSSSKESDLQVINRLRLLEDKIAENSKKTGHRRSLNMISMVPFLLPHN